MTKTKTRRASPVTAPPAQEQRGPIMREHDTWNVGDIAFQGDLIFICVARMPPGATPRANRQLADGETKGSRHILEGGECFDAPTETVAKLIATATKNRCMPPAAYVGPVFAGPCVVRHPQHQDQAFPADTVTACVFQRNLDSENREVRARD